MPVYSISDKLYEERKSKAKYCKEGIIKLQSQIDDVKKQMIPKEEKEMLINNLNRAIEHYKQDLFFLEFYLP